MAYEVHQSFGKVVSNIKVYVRKGTQFVFISTMKSITYNLVPIIIIGKAGQWFLFILQCMHLLACQINILLLEEILVS